MFPDKLSKSETHKLSTGTMFDFGRLNDVYDTKDSIICSIWDISGTLMRYRRVYSTMVPYPPIKEDKRGYLSLSKDKRAVYWISY